MNKSDTTYVAGLLEGSGCFFEQNGYIGIRTNSGDKDVLQKACDITGCGKVVGPYNKRSSNKKYREGRPVFTWNVSPEADAVWLMERVLPYMGGRRAQRIVELLAMYDAKVEAAA